MIRTLYERFFCAPVLAFVLGMLLMAASVALWPIIELIGGLHWWSFGPAVPL